MKRLRKFLSLTPSDRLLLINAWLLLGGIRLGLWLVPFHTLSGFVRRVTTTMTRLQENTQTSINQSHKVSWAIETVSRYMPRVKCLARAFTTQILLSWYGQSANLCIGVAKSESGQLQAHAWVESQGTIVIGNLPDLSRYSPLPSLPS